jgi:predicted DCC family thiol-disulfide oxidoreductase YuxK
MTTPAPPDYHDPRPLFIFDHVCVLCSGGVSFIMKHDRTGKIAFTPAQGALGGQLCDYFGIDWNATYVFIRNGRAFTKSDGYFEVARTLGGWWRLTLVFRIIPRPLRDWTYDMIARNRYRWFGKTAEACQLLTPEQRGRLI